MHSERILTYHFNLDQQSEKIKLPRNVEWLFPYHEPEIRRIMAEYYNKYYADDHDRTLIFGINPGRFGAGLTGIPFTDPKQLREICGIENDLPRKPEISAEFIHLAIKEFGGLEKFNTQFYITSLCPLGFIKNGVNYNYYDDKMLETKVTPLIIHNITEQKKIVNAKDDIAYCLGEGKNYEFFTKLNEKHHFFKSIVPLYHPRWIMQYRRKRMNEFLKIYIEKLTQS